MDKELTKNILIICLLTFGFIGILSGLFFLISCQQAKTINKISETTYTCGDLFWAKKTVEQQVQKIQLKVIK